jgi:hypothetical protein
MLRYILFDTTLFDGEKDVEATRTDLMWLLEALSQRNQNYLAQRPNTPALYKSGVKYQLPQQYDGDPEEVQVLKNALGSAAGRADVAKVLDNIRQVFGGERFRDVGQIIANGGGDCDNLACWRVAELRQMGIQADPYMTNRPSPDGGGTIYHALVLWPAFANVGYRTVEDPSLLLGMSQPQRAKERDEEIRKNQERCDLIKKYGVKYIGKGRQQVIDPFADVDFEEVLGVRRAPAVFEGERDRAEVKRILRGGR